MLQRSLHQLSSSALGLAPLLASCSSSLCCQLAGTRPSCSSSTGAASTSSTSSWSSTTSSNLLQAVFTRGFRTGVVEVQQRPRRTKAPYFNPEDGPEAYRYWEDLWRHENPRKKRVIPKRQPVYLEQEQQEELCQAAIAAGIPEKLVYGDISKHELPRLVSAMHIFRPKFTNKRHRDPATLRQPVVDSADAATDAVAPDPSGGIPTDPVELTARIQALQRLEGSVPGLDFTRIYQMHGFGVLSVQSKHTARRILQLRRTLAKAGVTAEAGAVFTANPKMAFFSSSTMVERAQGLLQAFEQTCGKAPEELLSNPFQAQLLGQSNNSVQRRLNKLTESHGKKGAARIAGKLPQLLAVSQFQHNLKVAALAKMFEGKSEAVAKSMVAREPRLLTHAVRTLKGRVRKLQQLLQLTPEELLQLVDQQPSLLHKAPGTLQGKLQHLQDTNSVTEAQAIDMAKGQPKLLTFSAKRMSTILQLLNRLADSSPAWQARVDKLLAGKSIAELATVLANTNTLPRLQHVQQQQQQQQQQQGNAPAILELVAMPVAAFAEQFGVPAVQQKQGAVAET